MKHKSLKTHFWVILTLVNVAVMAYPVGLCFQAETTYDKIVATFTMLGVAGALAITDLVSAIIAYTK